MKIVYVGNLPPHPGGSAFLAVDVLGALIARGHDVIAISPRAVPAFGHELAAPKERFRLLAYDVPHPDLDRTKPASDAYVLQQYREIEGRLDAVVENERPDVLLIGAERFVWGLPAFTARRGIPCIQQTHGRILTLAEEVYPEPYQSRYLDELRRTDLIVCCARHAARAARGLGIRAVATVPNSVDTTQFKPRQRDPEMLEALSLDEEAMVALHVSSLKPLKRPYDLIASAASVIERCPQLIYLVVGDSEYREAVERACEELGIADSVRFVGSIDHRQLPQLYALSDVTVMPSTSEAMSLVCLEAMACGKLVVASDIPGMREIIRDDETGLLFEMGNVEDLTAKTLLAARDPELRERIGGAARAHVEKHHRLEDMVTRYEALLTDLVDARSSKP